MLKLTQKICLGVLFFNISACSHLEKNEGVKKDSAASSPSKKFNTTIVYADGPDDHATLDPMYMQMQADYHFSIGESLALEGDSAKAIESFKNTLVYDPNSVTVHLRIAAENLKLGQIKEALDFAEYAEKLDGKNVETKLLLGGLYSSMRLYPKAQKCYEEVLKLEPQNSDAPLYLGAIMTEQGHFEKAVKYFELLAKNPEFGSPHLVHYYIARVRLGQKEEKYQKAAEAALKRSIEIKPDFVDGVLALYNFYKSKKQDKLGIQLLVNFQNKEGPSNKVADVLAQHYIEKEKYDEAYEQFEIMESGSDDSLSIKMKMALILMDKKIYDRAISKLEEILILAPESDKVRFYLAAVYEEVKNNEKSLFHFEKVTSTSQFYVESVVHSAYLLKQMNRSDEAIALLDKALSEKKDQPNLFVMKASLLDEKENYISAAGTLELALEKFPNNTQIHFYYATISDKLGKKEKVISHMKKVLDLDPEHIQGLNYLAFTWAESGENLESAEKYARKAMKLDPQDGFVMDTLGWILYKQGRVSESISILEAAFKKQPNVGVIAEHLGDAYSKRVLVEKAKLMYNKALDLETDQKKIDDLREKITAIEDQKLNENRMPASIGGR